MGTRSAAGASGRYMGSYYNSRYSANEPGRSLQQGIVGLRNLGNTCFMNSTLQCFFQTPLLSPYFLSRTHSYKLDINRDNPLGWKGRIAEAYGELVNTVWNNRNKVVSPADIKHEIGRFQPRFSGYQQHDSSELLSFLLDGLHEDLNRVRKKPATEQVEGDGRPDRDVANEAWEVHLQRNQSVIVDYMQGQLKSKLVCPDCGRVSITFDPFMFLSVPLPQKMDKRQLVTFVPADVSQPMEECETVIAKVALIQDLKMAVGRLAGVSANRMVICETLRHGFRRVYRDDESVKMIFARDEISAIEVPYLESNSLHTTRLIQIEHSVDSGRTLEKFGTPTLAAIEKADNTTYGDVYATTLSAVKPFMTAEALEAMDANDAEPPFTMYVSAYASYYNRGTELEPGDDHVVRNLRYANTLRVTVVWNDKELYADREVVSKETEEDVPAKSGKDELLLSDCIREFTKEETLSETDMWYCRDCKKHVQAEKKFDLWRLPDILIVHLKRFSYSAYLRDKIDTFVDFPTRGFDVGQYCTNEDERDAIYDLYAVSNHMGGMGGGHYTAYAKNLKDQTWYSLDDSRVRAVDENAIKSSSAYVLFYHRRSVATDPAAFSAAAAGGVEDDDDDN